MRKMLLVVVFVGLSLLGACSPSTFSYLSGDEIAFSQIESNAERQRILNEMYAEYLYEFPREPQNFENSQAQRLYDSLIDELSTEVRGVDLANQGRYRFAASAYNLSKAGAKARINQILLKNSIDGAWYLQIVVHTFEGFEFLGLDDEEQARDVYGSLGFEPRLSYEAWLQTLPVSIRDPNYDFEARRRRERAREERKSQGASCCRVCTVGKPCGNSCINRNETCYAGAGCACAGDVNQVFYAGLLPAFKLKL